MSLENTIKQFNSLSSNLKGDLDSLINEILSTDLTLPTYDKAVSKKVLYTSYAGVVDLNNRVGATLLMSHKLLLSLKELKRELCQNKNVNFNVISVYKDRVTNEIDSLSEKVKAVTEYKQSLEQTLRFYQSLQYILSSYRMED